MLCLALAVDGGRMSHGHSKEEHAPSEVVAAVARSTAAALCARPRAISIVESREQTPAPLRRLAPSPRCLCWGDVAGEDEAPLLQGLLLLRCLQSTLPLFVLSLLRRANLLALCLCLHLLQRRRRPKGDLVHVSLQVIKQVIQLYLADRVALPAPLTYAVAALVAPSHSPLALVLTVRAVRLAILRCGALALLVGAHRAVGCAVCLMSRLRLIDEINVGTASRLGGFGTASRASVR